MNFEEALNAILYNPQQVGAFAGCYMFVKNKKTILYVGQSRNIKKRMRQHSLLHLIKDGVLVHCVECENHIELEKLLIKHFKPKNNYNHRIELKVKTKTKKRRFTHIKLSRYIADTSLTQKQFAIQLGIAPAYLSQILHAVRKPSGELMCKLHEVTGGYLSWDDFYGDDAIYG